MLSISKQLAERSPLVGLCVMYPAPGVVERIGPDWDWIWIDGQHGQLGYNDVLSLVRACDLIGRPAVVRVAGHEFGGIGLALDTGAAGLIVPCVDTPEQARAVVDAAKFPPLGKRSFGGRRPIDRLGRTYSDTANEDVLLVVQVESPQAIENASQIAAIPGVDALFLGPDDVLLRRGHSVNEKRSEANLGKDMRAVMEACTKHGKFSVMVAGDEDMLRLCASMGFSMIVGGGDVPFLAVSSKQASAKARAILELQSAPDGNAAARDNQSAHIY